MRHLKLMVKIMRKNRKLMVLAMLNTLGVVMGQEDNSMMSEDSEISEALIEMEVEISSSASDLARIYGSENSEGFTAVEVLPHLAEYLSDVESTSSTYTYASLSDEYSSDVDNTEAPVQVAGVEVLYHLTEYLSGVEMTYSEDVYMVINTAPAAVEVLPHLAEYLSDVESTSSTYTYISLSDVYSTRSTVSMLSGEDADGESLLTASSSEEISEVDNTETSEQTGDDVLPQEDTE